MELNEATRLPSNIGSRKIPSRTSNGEDWKRMKGCDRLRLMCLGIPLSTIVLGDKVAMTAHFGHVVCDAVKCSWRPYTIRLPLYDH